MISVTDLAAYEYCPRKLFLNKVLKIIEIPKEAVLLGSIRHEAFDKLNKIEENIVKDTKKEINYQDLLQKYKKHYSSILQHAVIKNKTKLAEFNLDLTETFKKAWNSVFLEAKERAYNTYKFMEKTGFLGEELWEALTPKIDSEYWISSEELKMKGIIDQVRIYPEEVIPYELKTGKAPNTGVWPGHQLQLGAYVMLLRSEGKTSNSGFVSYLDLEEKRAVPFNPFLETKILDLRDEVIELLGSSKLPDRITNLKKCNACSLKEQCFDDKFMEKRIKSYLNS